MAKRRKKEQKEEVKKNSKFLNFIFFIILLIIGVILYARYIGTSGLIVKEYRIQSESIPTNYSGVKIVHFSDILFNSTFNLKDIDKLVEKINILNPDIVVFTGNLFNSSYTKNDSQEKKLIEKLGELESTLGKYAIKGKHDKEESFNSVMLSSGFKVLDDSYELVYNESTVPIFIGNIKETTDTNMLFSSIDKNVYKILLFSEVDKAKTIINSEHNINLILGGNSLNGSVNLPFYGQVFIPEGSKTYYAPYYKENNIDIYISSGLGTDKYKFRLFNKPSFNLYRLKSL